MPFCLEVCSLIVLLCIDSLALKTKKMSEKLRLKYTIMVPDRYIFNINLSYLRATYPLHQAWKLMITSVIFMSLSSSRWARTPALKNTLLWPMRYRFGSSSRALIWHEEDMRRLGDKSYSLKWRTMSQLLYFWMNCLLLKLIYCSYHEHAGLLAVHKAFWNRIWSKDFVPERQTSTIKLLK